MRCDARDSRSMTFTIGVISDTHGLLRSEAERQPAGVDRVIHGGDVGSPDIVPAFRRIAPVSAIRGNVYTGTWVDEFPETRAVRFSTLAKSVVNVEAEADL